MGPPGVARRGSAKGKLVTEGIGAFLLVLTIRTRGRGRALWAPVAIGSVLAAIVYMGWHVSGVHHNPAVTLARPPAGAVQLLLVEFLVAFASSASWS